MTSLSASDLSIPVPSRIVLWTDNKASSFLCTLVDCFDDINQLLLVLEYPVQLVVIPSTEVTHHMFIAKKKHQGNGVVQLFKIDVSINT
jgi:hypothetical protein